MTNKELIEKHDEGTMICSVMSHMRSASPTYNEIIAKGKIILPDILKYLKDNQSGMNIILLLQDIVKLSPYQPEEMGETGFGEYIVADARKAWINWGVKEKLI
jgi:hypothetical protein